MKMIRCVSSKVLEAYILLESNVAGKNLTGVISSISLVCTSQCQSSLVLYLLAPYLLACKHVPAWPVYQLKSGRVWVGEICECVSLKKLLSGLMVNNL